MTPRTNQHLIGSIPLAHKLPNVHYAAVMFLRWLERITLDFGRWMSTNLSDMTRAKSLKTGSPKSYTSA